MGVVALVVEEDISSPSRHQVATWPKAIIELKAEVGGLDHVGNPSLAEDGAHGLLHMECFVKGYFDAKKMNYFLKCVWKAVIKGNNTRDQHATIYNWIAF